MKMVTQIFATGISLKVLQRGTLWSFTLLFLQGALFVVMCNCDRRRKAWGADYVLSVPLSMEIVTQNLWHSRSV